MLELKDYLVLSLSFGALVFSYINTKMQIKANREQMKADNMIKLRSDWIQRFSALIVKIKYKMSEIVEYAMSLDYKDENIDWNKFNNTKRQIYFLQSELNLFVTIEGETLIYDGKEEKTLTMLINEMYTLFTDFFNNKFDSFEEQQKGIHKLQIALATFSTEALHIIEEQTKRLVK